MNPKPHLSLGTSAVFVFTLTLIATMVIPALAETEPNNTIPTANPVELNTSVEGTLSLDPMADVYDCYQFTLDRDGYFQVGIVPTAELNVWVRLLDTDGVTRMASSNIAGKGGTEGIVYKNLRAGTYYVIVGLADGSGSYTATFNFAPVQHVDPEPNDSAPQASTVDPDSGQAEGHLGYSGSLHTDISDYYKIIVAEDGALQVTVSPDQDLRIALALYDNTSVTKNMIWRDSGGKGGSETIQQNDLAAGTYYLLVYRSEGFGSYTLTSQFTEMADPNDTEPNNVPGQAVDLPLTASAADPSVYQGSVNGRLGFYGNQHRDDRDWYTITTPSYGKLSFNYVKGSGNNLDAGYALFNSELRYIGSTDNDTAAWSALPAGLYFLRFYRQNQYGGYALSCTFEEETPPEPFTEPTAELAPNATLVDLGLDEATPNRYFNITLPEDGKLVIRSQYTDGIYAITKLLQGDGKTEIASTSSYYTSAEQAITVPDLRKGTYIVKAERNRDQGLVTLTSEFTPVTKLDTEPNDCWESLSPSLVLNESVTDVVISGHIGYGGNGWRDVMDAYLLDVQDNGAISVTAVGDSTMYWHVALMEKRGNVYANLSSIDPYYTTAENSVGKANILAGKYLIYVYRMRDYGSYDLKVNFTPNRSSDPEPNDHSWQADTITPGQGVVGNVGYQKWDYTDGDDFYKINLPADGSLGVFIRSDNTLYYTVRLYNSDRTWQIDAKSPYYTADAQTVSHSHLRKGTYYIQIHRERDYGTYQFYTVFKEQPKKDSEPNNLATMAVPLALGEMAQGAIGYQTGYDSDHSDWYVVNVPTAGRYKLNYQNNYATLYNSIYVYASDMFTRVRSDNRYYSTDLYAWEADLEVGTYYIQVVQERDYGPYTLRFGDPEGVAAGSLSGTVSGSNSFPLFEVSVGITNRTIQTDFSGTYRFDNLAPGTYPVHFSSGAKYYELTETAEIRAGEETTLDAVLQDANTTAPSDPEHFYAIPNDRYIHLFWSPSPSPDVADGGGYKLYVDNEEANDLGYIHQYRRDGFENGRTYTFRLTVYDKFGNESEGRTLQVTPTAGSPSAGILGDANGNRRLDIGDALAIAQFLGGLRDTLPAAGNADINQNGRIDIGDAMYVAQVLGGLRSDPNLDVAKGLPHKKRVGLAPPLGARLAANLSIGVQVDAGPYSPGDTVMGHLLVDVGSSPLGAYDLVITYDPTLLSISAVQAGSSTEFGAPTVANFDNTTGRLLINDFQSTSLTGPTGQLELAVIVFDVVAASGQSTEIHTTVTSVQDTNFLDIPVVPQSGEVPFSGGIVATPIPTPSPQPGPGGNLSVGVLVDPTVAYNAGDLVRAPLVAEVGTSPLGAYDLTITYDPATLAITKVDPGSSTEFGAPTVANFDNAAGRLLINDFQSASLTAPTGRVELAVIEFQVVAVTGSSASIDTSVTSLQDVDFNEIGVASESAQVQLESGGGGPIDTPTPTPTLTPTLTSTVTPAPNPTEAPATGPTPIMIFELNSQTDFNEYPGGFIGAPPGQATVGNIPGPTGDLTDGIGATISTDPGELDLLLFPAVEVGDHSVLIRVSVQASGPGAQIALAALDGSMDGSIGTFIPANSAIYQDNYKRMILVFDPPGTTIMPIIQVFNNAGTTAVNVFIDNLQVYAIPKSGEAFVNLLNGN